MWFMRTSDLICPGVSHGEEQLGAVPKLSLSSTLLRVMQVSTKHVTQCGQMISTILNRICRLVKETEDKRCPLCNYQMKLEEVQRVKDVEPLLKSIAADDT